MRTQFGPTVIARTGPTRWSRGCGPERQAVDDGGREARVDERLAPFAERAFEAPPRTPARRALSGPGTGARRRAGRDGHRRASSRRSRSSRPYLDEPRQRPLVGRLGEFVDRPCRRHVADPEAALAGGHAEPDQQVTLAGAAVAEEDDRLARRDPGARLERGQGGRVDRRRPARSNSDERLGRGKRLGDPPLPPAGLAIVELGGEHFGEIDSVGRGRPPWRARPPARGRSAGGASGRRPRS